MVPQIRCVVEDSDVTLLRDHQTDHFTFWTAKQVKILKMHIEGRRQIYRPEEDILMPCRKKTPITTLSTGKNCVLDLLYQIYMHHFCNTLFK